MCPVVDDDGSAHERPHGITLALISAKLDVVLEKLAEFKIEIDDHQERIRELETDAARLKERVGLFAVALGVGQLAGSALAAYIGAMR